MVKNLWLGLEKSLFFPSGSRAVVVVDVADALRLVSLPPHRSLLGRTLILCDLSRVEHEALYVSAQGTSPAEASRARGNTPNRPLGIIGGSKRSRFFPLSLIIFFSLSFYFNLFHLPSTGKVHGSLARAGKVRGQTPKVAKQDKKKLPKVSFLFFSFPEKRWLETLGREKKKRAHLFFVSFALVLLSLSKKNSQGRAMKRIKYNRRFVNVVVGMGKKKSPNSQ